MRPSVDIPAQSPLAARLQVWQVGNGRHGLPWQRERTPYRVWISEIMLQQTQVSTVIPYFERFMQRFPEVSALADAPLDEVLHEWTGLGYYARARNLHRAAQVIRDEHAGVFPEDFASVCNLPGIGRSTAGAILALSMNQAHAILDGNAKRVLARYFAIEGHPSERAVEQRLWALAEACTPKQDVAVYTQAMMDLGATLCTRRNPDCARCPLQSDCGAYALSRQHEIPGQKPSAARKPRPRRRCWMLFLQAPCGAFLLEQRPAKGIWGGLWSPREYGSDVALREAMAALGQISSVELPALDHAFTHFDLTIYPVHAQLATDATRLSSVAEPAATLWYKLDTDSPTVRIGLPMPVKHLLQELTPGMTR